MRLDAVRYGVKAWFCKAMLAAAFAVCAGAAQAEIRLVALGDSLVQGYGLPAEDGFTPRLEAWLRANGAPDVVVINAGVSGDTSAGGRARLDWALGDGADALIVELGGNDLLRAIDPAATRENIAAILSEAKARDLPVLLTGMQAPLNYGPEYKEEFDALYPELADRYGALYDPFFLDGLTGKPALFQADGVHPNAAGVDKLVERFGPLALDLIAKAREEG